MTTRELLSELERRGCVLAASGEIMTASPAAKITPALLAELKVHKPKLLAAWTHPGVRQVVEAVHGRIVDVRSNGEIEVFPWPRNRSDGSFARKADK